ncbi:MAG TPA: AraC family transcriptional regulator [Dyella sp.]|nr:AraC family transcriptional regulator [Dyella sp.]
MTDPLAEVVTLLQPSARFAKTVAGAGRWHVQRSDAGEPFYCVVLEGGCRVGVEGHPPIALAAGDFLLVPAAWGVAMSSLEPPPEGTRTAPVAQGDGLYRIGEADEPADLRMLVGHCHFDSPDAGLLVSLLPRLVHVRGERRLALLVKLLGEESRTQRPAREVVLSRLLEVLLIEALRSTAGTAASPGLVRGLADERLGMAIRAMHAQPTRGWTVAELAKEAALSRSAFFERFNRTVGVAPMAYLLAWRMALAKHLLRRREGRVADVAERVGYSSTSTFSLAFTRHVGVTPSRYAREQSAARVVTEPA